MQRKKKTCSICTSLEIQPFKIRYSKHPSFTHYSIIWAQQRRNTEGEDERGGDGEIKRVRERTQQVKEGP